MAEMGDILLVSALGFVAMTLMIPERIRNDGFSTLRLARSV